MKFLSVITAAFTNSTFEVIYHRLQTLEWRKKVTNVLAAALINIVINLMGISLFTYSLAMRLPLLKGQHGRTQEMRCSHE